MQSERSARALAALLRSRNAFHSAIVASIDELGTFLMEQRAPIEQRAAQEATRLGVFGADRLDVGRFSLIVGATDLLEPARLDQLEHALRVLKSFAAQGDDLYRIVMRRGADLRDTIRDALSARGRAFNTAHQIEILRTGRAGLHVELEYGSLDFRHWTRAERNLAPPLVVEANGADVQVSGLAEYMDGAQKIVLIIDGATAPAPLSRLIAPHTFVMQTTDPNALDRLGAFDGPGIAAVVPDGCAVFAHDPSGGGTLAQRLIVEHLPQPVNRGVAGGSARQQAEEIAWLGELARLASLAASPVLAAGLGARPPADVAEVAPADQLAAWLLHQADLTVVE
ncbi:hypothetical protein BH23GEM9_BH23GEM9_33900 [soil metagenome]